MTTPTPPIELTGHADRLPGTGIELPHGFLDRLGAACDIVTEVTEVAEASRDWWPLALHWSLTCPRANQA